MRPRPLAASLLAAVVAVWGLCACDSGGRSHGTGEGTSNTNDDIASQDSAMSSTQGTVSTQTAAANTADFCPSYISFLEQGLVPDNQSALDSWLRMGESVPAEIVTSFFAVSETVIWDLEMKIADPTAIYSAPPGYGEAFLTFKDQADTYCGRWPG